MSIGLMDSKGAVLCYEKVCRCKHPGIDNILPWYESTSRRTIPYTMSYNPGLVFLNLYDYPGPTLFFSDELKAFRSPDRDTQAAAMQRRGLELAKFLRWFVEVDKITQIPQQSSSNSVTAGGSPSSDAGKLSDITASCAC
ncbi:hypothetical protein AcW2_007066 [Taiwanofungus camphoratus]|nr:hypothetical protein AcW2_007066 [Antrodia cinnamomea]